MTFLEKAVCCMHVVFSTIDNTTESTHGADTGVEEAH